MLLKCVLACALLKCTHHSLPWLSLTESPSWSCQQVCSCGKLSTDTYLPVGNEMAGKSAIEAETSSKPLFEYYYIYLVRTYWLLGFTQPTISQWNTYVQWAQVHFKLTAQMKTACGNKKNINKLQSSKYTQCVTCTGNSHVCTFAHTYILKLLKHGILIATYSSNTFAKLRRCILPPTRYELKQSGHTHNQALFQFTVWWRIRTCVCAYHCRSLIVSGRGCRTKKRTSKTSSPPAGSYDMRTSSLSTSQLFSFRVLLCAWLCMQ